VDTWRRLVDLAQEHNVDVALVQEAGRPRGLAAEQLQTWPDKTDPNAWHTWDRPDSIGRYSCSALAWFPWSRWDVTGERRTRLVAAKWDEPTISHPGQFAVGRVSRSGETVMTIVSLYGIWDSRPEQRRYIFPEATLHRAISDLTPLLLTCEPVVIAGDLNILIGYGKEIDPESARTDTVFQRLATYGVELAGPYRDVGEALEGCPCNQPDTCRHVATRPEPSGRPLQLDWVFSNRAETIKAIGLPIEALSSDHAPVLIDVALP
jgi:endonuclease/exonuclease/phosphatase family metal-dependent hydrolase